MTHAYVGTVALGLLVLVAVSYLSFTGFKLDFTPSNDHENGGPLPQGPSIAPSLVRGAACETNEECVYAENAYPILRCISPNCPPEDSPEQPVQGDPAYEWLDAYQGSCVNGNELGFQNALGEPLQVSTRSFSCACEPIPAGPNGERTSITGQKICMTHPVE